MNYTELKTAIADWEHRSYDAGKLDTFIDLFEARASRNLRTLEMETRETFTPASEFHPLPAGFIAFRNVQANLTYPHTLEYASPQKIASAGLTGDPTYYTFNGNQVEFSPSASGKSMEWTYYKAIPALSSSTATNWLLNKHPDYYLMGCIQQALIWSLDDRAGQVEAMLANMESIINQERNQAMSGPLRVSAL